MNLCKLMNLCKKSSRGWLTKPIEILMVSCYEWMLFYTHFTSSLVFCFSYAKMQILMSIPPKMNTYTCLFCNMTYLGSHEVRIGELEPLSSMIQVVKSPYFSIAPKSSIGLDQTLLGGQVCV